MKTSASRRADRLAQLHAELRHLIRRATNETEADLFDRSKPAVQTREAATASRTITMSLREAADLFRAAMPPTARDTSSRLNHALLIISLRHLLDQLRAISSNEVPAPAIAAAELAARQLRTWLRAAARTNASRAKRPAIATAQTTLLLPLNRIAIQRHETPPFHNPVPVRSQPAATQPRAEPEKAETGTATNETTPEPRRTA